MKKRFILLLAVLLLAASVALISAGEGLWSLSAAETETGSYAETMDTVDYFLVRIPEP